MWNVTSMVNKTALIMEHIIDRDPSIVFISETWLRSKSNDVTAMIKSYGYTLLHNIRKNRQKDLGGGVGVLLKTELKFKHELCKQFSSFELTVVKVNLKNDATIYLLSIYRVLFVSVVTFLDEITELLEMATSKYVHILLAGDVNIHMDEDESYSNRFKDILESFNIKQHVNTATHIHGHTLDIIATFLDGPAISNVVVNEYDLSHHYLVDFVVSVSPVKKQQKTISFRDLRKIDTVKFKTELNDRLLVLESMNFGENIQMYNQELSGLLNNHAPVKHCTIKIVPEAPWFDKDYAELRKKRRKAERLYRRTGLSSHKANYVSLRKQTLLLAHQKKCSFYRAKFDKGNAKQMYSSLRQLLDHNKEVVLPTRKSDVDLANLFSELFSDKIEKIRSSFANVQSDSPSTNSSDPCVSPNKLSSFDPVTEDDLREIVVSFGIKCSPEDPFPNSLLTQNLDIFLPIWTKLVNLSLAEGTMDCLKNAIISPLLKEMDSVMNKDNLKNYRPVSNLMFVGKLIERVVSRQLDKHMMTNGLQEDFQFGYKAGHSCETLLMKILNDLLSACDKNLPIILLLLDLSAAFDTIDQRKCLKILREEIGVEGVALKWFESFLVGRTQKIKIGNSYSAESHLHYGAPQGSVLAPRLFNIYTRSIKKHIEPTKFSIFGFADDHQLLKMFLPMLQTEALGGDIVHCFDLITEWMKKSFLKLNAAKTKILIVAPPAVAQKIIIGGSFINSDCVRFVHSARNLGITIDDGLTFEKQITKVVQSCFLTIRELSKIKSFLTYEHLRTAISTFVFSKLDYCNALYYGVNGNLLRKMQLVQNCAARLMKSKWIDSDISISEVIKSCHWLRIRDRILFKLCLIVHKCVHGTAPKMLCDLLTFSSSSRTLLLTQRNHNSKFGDRCFARIGPKIWNLLPMELRLETKTDVFKASLKTLLFDDGDWLCSRLHEK